MQAAQSLAAGVTSSLESRAGSLRHLSRFGAVAIGIASGIIAVSNQAGARESAFRAAISERDGEIAKLKSANNMLEMEKTGKKEKPSSGDPVQDWIDSLAE